MSFGSVPKSDLKRDCTSFPGQSNNHNPAMSQPSQKSGRIVGIKTHADSRLTFVHKKTQFSSQKRIDTLNTTNSSKPHSHRYYTRSQSTNRESKAACSSSNVDEEILNKHGYELRRKLGTGRYCKVRKAIDIMSRYSDLEAQVAVKIIDTTNVRSEFLNKFLPRELAIWPTLNHPHLVKMREQFSERNKVYMVLEYVPGGDLLRYIQDKGSQSEEKSRIWLNQLISAIRYLHMQGIAHRDLKLENILMADDLNLKIADFGFCRRASAASGDCNLSSTYCGSKAYSAPEILKGQKYDPFKADVWSLGVIAFIVVTGRMPFNEHVAHQSQIVDNQRKHNYRFPTKLNISIECQQTVNEILTFDWRKRPTICDVQLMDWFHIAQHEHAGDTAEHCTCCY